VERIGHRGAKRELPENTLPAFRRAWERGADAVELDVHATSDGVVVVHHDPVVVGLGSSRITIAEAAWSQLKEIELDPGVFVPRLSDVLDAAPPWSTVYVEIKGSAIESLVARDIRARGAGRAGRAGGGGRAACAVHSFDHRAIATMRDIAPEIPRGILFERAGVDLSAAIAFTAARDVWPHWKLIDRTLVDSAHSLGARVIAWTVNDPAVATSLEALGVDGLCGDDVRLLPR
jgi:glycerophosphoryl diester phosphodiesterase